MKIANTAVEARHPWPEQVHVQGGGDGLVVRRADGSAYRTAFVEAFPTGTFLRGEGLTVEEAEDACWAKYQVFSACDGTGEPHGPFEARGYTNGSGFCTRCGAWMSHVLEPSIEHRAESAACEIVRGKYGDDIPGSRWWTGLVADWTARILAQANGTPAPVPTTVEPTEAELAEWRTARARPLDPAVLVELLERLSGEPLDGPSTGLPPGR